MTSVLVTGGAGYIGSHACKALAETGFVPTTFDSLERGWRDQVRFGPLIQGDLLSPSELDTAFRASRPEAVLHFAAYAYVGESTQDPLRYYRNNVFGLVNLLDAMRRHRVGKIVFSSSCATYGLQRNETISEKTAQRPINPYGASKLMCERIITDAAASAPDLRFAILRYFNAAGADASGTLAERHDPETHLIPLAIDAALGRAPPLRIFGTDYRTADGTCERDYIHVTDLADAHVKALGHIGRAGQLIVNLGSGRPSSVRQVIDEVARVTGRPVPFEAAPRRAGDPPRLVADISLARRTLGFDPALSTLGRIVDTAYASRIGRTAAT